MSYLRSHNQPPSRSHNLCSHPLSPASHVSNSMAWPAHPCALRADWGRVAGQGGTAWHKKYYTPDEKDACPKHPYDPFYVAITPATAAAAGDGPYIKKPNDPCVVKTCLSFLGDHQENCEGEAISPWQHHT